jgi:hypothetical protein
LSKSSKHPDELRPSDLPVLFIALDEPRHGLSMTSSINAQTNSNIRLHFRPNWNQFRMELRKNGKVQIDWVSMAVVSRYQFVSQDAAPDILKRYGMTPEAPKE